MNDFTVQRNKLTFTYEKRAQKKSDSISDGCC